MPQYLSPSGQTRFDRWRNSADPGDSTLWDLVDEASPDDADSIVCPDGTGTAQAAQIAALSFPAADEPTNRLGHKVYVRLWQYPDPDGNFGHAVTVRLTDGTATKTWAWGAPVDPTTYQLDVDEATAETFVDYTALSVEIERPLGQGGLYVSWVLVEVPYPPFAHLDMSDGGLIVAAAESGHYLTTDGGGIVRVAGDETDGALTLGDGGGHGIRL